MAESASGAVRPQSGVCVVVATAYNASISAKTSMWIPWARAAARHLRDAGRARAELIAAQDDPDSKKVSRALSDEHESSLVAICSAVFAIEALSRSLRGSVADAATAQAWDGGAPCATCGAKKRPLPMEKHLRQILQRSVRTRSVVNELADRWKPLIVMRDEAVHFMEETLPTQPHPSGTGNTAVEVCRYSFEMAQEALDLLATTLIRLRDDPTPAAAPLATRYTSLIDELPYSMEIE